VGSTVVAQVFQSWAGIGREFLIPTRLINDWRGFVKIIDRKAITGCWQ
jgi:hypothetical protein